MFVIAELLDSDRNKDAISLLSQKLVNKEK